jgi:hypothetical protein
MRLAFCAACGSAEDLHHHHLVTRSEGGQACQSVPASQLRWRSRSANESLGEGRPGAQGQPRAVSNRRVTKPWSVSRSAKPRFEAIAATLPFGGVSYENKVASFKAAERMREPSRADN